MHTPAALESIPTFSQLGVEHLNFFLGPTCSSDLSSTVYLLVYCNFFLWPNRITNWSSNGVLTQKSYLLSNLDRRLPCRVGDHQVEGNVFTVHVLVNPVSIEEGWGLRGWWWQGWWWWIWLWFWLSQPDLTLLLTRSGSIEVVPVGVIEGHLQ